MSALGDVAAIVTAATAITAIGGGYVQFVLKRSVFPSAEFDVQYTPYMRGELQLVGEVELVFKNVGSTMLVVTGVRSRIRCRLKNDAEVTIISDIAEPFFSYKVLPSTAVVAGSYVSSSLPPSAPSDASRTSQSSSALAADRDRQAPINAAPPGWLNLAQLRTFIQPGVTQRYRKPIALPMNTQLVHIWGAFDYQIDIGRTTRLLIKWLAAPPKNLDWRHGVNNHTVRRTFFVPTAPPGQPFRPSSENPRIDGDAAAEDR